MQPFIFWEKTLIQNFLEKIWGTKNDSSPANVIENQALFAHGIIFDKVFLRKNLGRASDQQILMPYQCYNKRDCNTHQDKGRLFSFGFLGF